MNVSIYDHSNLLNKQTIIYGRTYLLCKYLGKRTWI